jgi:hypothetical protein
MPAHLQSLAGALAVVALPLLGCGHDEPRARPAPRHTMTSRPRHLRTVRVPTHATGRLPAGIRQQFQYIAGGGAGFAAECAATQPPSVSPALAFALVPLEGDPLRPADRPRAGESFAACVFGLRSRTPVAFTVTRPNGSRWTRSRRVRPGQPVQLDVDLRPDAVLGRYTVTAQANGRALRRSFSVSRLRSPAVRIPDGFGPPGATFRAYAVGLRPGTPFELLVYRLEPQSTSAGLVANSSFRADPRSGGAIVPLSTSPSAQPNDCYVAVVLVGRSRYISGRAGASNFCLER